MKSLASRILETTLREDDVAPGTALLSPGAGTPDLPNDKGAAPADEQPVDNNTGAPDLQKMMEGMDCPDKMAEALDAMCDKADAYMDESDDSTYTVKDQKDKAELQEARGKMREAALKMYGKRK
jgi:hypothetical protein